MTKEKDPVQKKRRKKFEAVERIFFAIGLCFNFIFFNPLVSPKISGASFPAKKSINLRICLYFIFLVYLHCQLSGIDPLPFSPQPKDSEGIPELKIFESDLKHFVLLLYDTVFSDLPENGFEENRGQHKRV